MSQWEGDRVWLGLVELQLGLPCGAAEAHGVWAAGADLEVVVRGGDAGWDGEAEAFVAGVEGGFDLEDGAAEGDEEDAFVGGEGVEAEAVALQEEDVAGGDLREGGAELFGEGQEEGGLRCGVDALEGGLGADLFAERGVGTEPNVEGGVGGEWLGGAGETVAKGDGEDADAVDLHAVSAEELEEKLAAEGGEHGLDVGDAHAAGGGDGGSEGRGADGIEGPGARGVAGRDGEFIGTDLVVNAHGAGERVLVERG